MDIRFLINFDGNPFDSAELRGLRKSLKALSDESRVAYRNANAAEIAKLGGLHNLIVSGPGTGKSHLFLQRIDNWYKRDDEAKVIVTTFVRKLVSDLNSDIEEDPRLKKREIAVSTLHRLARSVVETSGGTAGWPFEKHIRVIGQSWKNVVWNDVLTIASVQVDNGYNWGAFEKQLHEATFSSDAQWRKVTQRYFELCRFYNAAGFADLVIRARDALREHPGLIDPSYFIVDEYQDFNEAENQLIDCLTKKAKGLLVVGDDEQVLYERLKSGDASLIRELYQDKAFVNAMLPFCGRCSYHITRAADHFISQSDDEDRIEKIYLPMESRQDDSRIQIVACATPATAVDYLAKFLEDHRPALDQRMTDLEQGTKKDAFLLILSPSREARFLGENASNQLHELIAPFRGGRHGLSDDFYELLTYYSVSKNPLSNFDFRKLLFFEAVSQERTIELIKIAISRNLRLCGLDEPEVRAILEKCAQVKTILDDSADLGETIELLQQVVDDLDAKNLECDLKKRPITETELGSLEKVVEDEAEIAESRAGHMSAVEFFTIVGAKGLSADHVIVFGFDNVNMGYITQNAFYVAITRARESLHLLTALKAGGAITAHDFIDRLPGSHVNFKSYRKSGRTFITYDSAQDFKDYLSKLIYVSRPRR